MIIGDTTTMLGLPAWQPPRVSYHKLLITYRSSENLTNGPDLKLVCAEKGNI